jgi:hypothetical protein
VLEECILSATPNQPARGERLEPTLVITALDLRELTSQRRLVPARAYLLTEVDDATAAAQPGICGVDWPGSVYGTRGVDEPPISPMCSWWEVVDLRETAGTHQVLAQAIDRNGATRDIGPVIVELIAR